MQTSFVLSQLRYPGMGGDVDDCAIVASVQAVLVTSPWLPAVGIRTFRAAAGNPDDPGPDGLTHSEVVRGIRGCYPSIADHIEVLSGANWSHVVELGESGHPLSMAVDSSRLPEPLAFGFDGRHRIALVKRGVPRLANPLAQPQTRWLRIEWSDVRSAVMRFGEFVNGNRGAWGVALPTDAEALELYVPDETPYSQEDLDAATAELQARIDAAREALDG